jgi:hypothetical protein
MSNAHTVYSSAAGTAASTLVPPSEHAGSVDYFNVGRVRAGLT